LLRDLEGNCGRNAPRRLRMDLCLRALKDSSRKAIHKHKTTVLLVRPPPKESL